jgi:hypothetical protein
MRILYTSFNLVSLRSASPVIQLNSHVLFYLPNLIKPLRVVLYEKSNLKLDVLKVSTPILTTKTNFKKRWINTIHNSVFIITTFNIDFLFSSQKYLFFVFVLCSQVNMFVMLL